jgi:2-phosphoglycerate kinase
MRPSDTPHDSGRPDWQVLLIGGNSGTGKTVLAHQLARRFGVGVTQADDLRLGLQRVTTPVDQPALHFFLATPGVWTLSAEELKDGLVGVSEVVSRAIEAVVDHHHATPYSIILEGDGIAPGLAARVISRGVPGAVRAFFLVEPTDAGIQANMAERGRGFDQFGEEEQRAQARMNWLYGERLRIEARRLGLPMVSTRPRATLFERALALLT